MQVGPALRVHGILEVHVDLVRLLVDQRASLGHHVDGLALLAPDRDLQPLLVAPGLVYLFLQVHNQALHHVRQLVLAVDFQGKPMVLLLEVLTV